MKRELQPDVAEAPPNWTRGDRLRLVVRFVEADLAGYSDGDWLKLREDFACYFLQRPKGVPALEDVGGFVPVLVADDPLEVPREWFVALQIEAGALLRWLAGEHLFGGLAQPVGHDGFRYVNRTADESRCIPINVEKTPLVRTETGWLLSVRGRGRDLFFELLFHLLEQEPADQIRLCPRPACGKMFYRIRRQEYCSRACVNKAYQDSPKGIAIRKRKYAEQGWKFGARSPAPIQKEAPTKPRPRSKRKAR